MQCINCAFFLLARDGYFGRSGTRIMRSPTTPRWCIGAGAESVSAEASAESFSS
jgi:hypothetical protein